MERKYRRRWNKLINFLENLAPDKFNIQGWVMESCIVGKRECGTVCCAIGWFPKIFPRTFKWAAWSIQKINGYVDSEYSMTANHLNITMNESMDLFTGTGNILGENPTPQMLANRLKEVYATKIGKVAQ